MRRYVSLYISSLENQKGIVEISNKAFTGYMGNYPLSFIGPATFLPVLRPKLHLKVLCY